MTPPTIPASPRKIAGRYSLMRILAFDQRVLTASMARGIRRERPSVSGAKAAPAAASAPTAAASVAAAVAALVPSEVRTFYRLRRRRIFPRRQRPLCLEFCFCRNRRDN